MDQRALNAPPGQELAGEQDVVRLVAVVQDWRADRVVLAQALGAQAPPVHRVVGVALDGDGPAVAHADAHAAAHRAVGAGVAGFGAARQLVLPDFGEGRCRRKAEERDARTRDGRASYPKELSPGHLVHEKAFQ